MKEVIEKRIKGIQCNSCDYKNENVKARELGDWVNKACPQCGKNLLTDAEFNKIKVDLDFVKLANKIEPLQQVTKKMSSAGGNSMKSVKVGDFVDFDGLVYGIVSEVEGEYVTFTDDLTNFPVTKHQDQLEK